MTNLTTAVRALAGAEILAFSLGAALLMTGPAASQTQGTIVWENATDSTNAKRKKLRAGGQGTGVKAGTKETIEIDSWSWHSGAEKKRQGAKRRAN